MFWTTVICLLFSLIVCVSYKMKFNLKELHFRYSALDTLPVFLAFSYNFSTHMALWVSYVPVFMPALLQKAR